MSSITAFYPSARHPRPRKLLLTYPWNSRHFFLILLLLLPLLARTQVQGNVVDSDAYPLAGATVTWEDGSGTTVDVNGDFTLPLVAGQQQITISYLGFEAQTIALADVNGPLSITLRDARTTLDNVTVTARDNGNSASVLKTRNVESISAKELRKAPCCSLAESFENSPVVDLTYGDPLTGRREIQMLGLRGNYTQISLEKRPMLDGLASPYSLDLIPGPWVEGIQIGKGSGSLESSAAGITGEINTELIKPTHGPQLYLNAFAGSQGRGELNVLGNRQISDKLYLGAAAHGSFTTGEHDFDGDTFYDMPNRETGVGMLRLFRNGGGNWEGQWNVLGAYDRRAGGQLERLDLDDPYRVIQNNRRVEVWGKTGFYGFRKAHQSLGTIYSVSLHDLDGRYGQREHLGRQQSYYFNGLYQTRIGNDWHRLTTGVTLRADQFQEQFAATDYSRNESTLGAFGEYTFDWEEDRTGAPYRAFTAILSLRADEHNLGGTQLSPRLNLKYNPSEQFAIRASGGRGWRSPNLLVDNLNWLTSSRIIQLDDREGNADNTGFIGLESAWNYGINLTGHVDVGNKQLEFVLDAYRTEFQNQVIVDAEQDFGTLRLYQLSGASRANSLLASVNYEVLPLVDVKLAYKYNDVQQTYRTNGLREVPLTPKHRFLATAGYDGARFKAHLNYHFVGAQRLIDFAGIPASVDVRQPQRSPAFGLLNAQFTYVANAKTEFYFGGENLTNRRQANAIIGAAAPQTGDYFDATQVYQPIFGARGYVGVRYTVE